jgi:hypothetical protein
MAFYEKDIDIVCNGRTFAVFKTSKGTFGLDWTKFVESSYSQHSVRWNTSIVFHNATGLWDALTTVNDTLSFSYKVESWEYKIVNLWFRVISSLITLCIIAEWAYQLYHKRQNWVEQKWMGILLFGLFLSQDSYTYIFEDDDDTDLSFLIGYAKFIAPNCFMVYWALMLSLIATGKIEVGCRFYSKKIKAMVAFAIISLIYGTLFGILQHYDARTGTAAYNHLVWGVIVCAAICDLMI